MSCRECFERIHDEVLAVAKLEERVGELRLLCGPRGQGASGGHGGSGSGGREMTLLADKSAELDRARARLERRAAAAKVLLYGTDGKGGLAASRSRIDADILCAHYLQGTGWARMVEQMVRPESKSPRHWCQMRALRALDFLQSHRMRAYLRSRNSRLPC